MQINFIHLFIFVSDSNNITIIKQNYHLKQLVVINLKATYSYFQSCKLFKMSSPTENQEIKRGRGRPKGSKNVNRSNRQIASTEVIINDETRRYGIKIKYIKLAEQGISKNNFPHNLVQQPLNVTNIQSKNEHSLIELHTDESATQSAAEGSSYHDHVTAHQQHSQQQEQENLLNFSVASTIHENFLEELEDIF